MATTYRAGSLGTGRQVHMVAILARQPLLKNGIQKTRGRAVIKLCGRLLGLQLQLYLYRMPLIGADARAVFAKGKALLVIARHHGLQLRKTHAAASACHAGQQFVRLRPACAIELEANGLRTVAQHQAEKLALRDDDVVLVVHILVFDEY